MLPIALTGSIAACQRGDAERADRNLATPLTTGFENERSAPLGPGAELVAYTAAAWDSGWTALGLPGTPPAVDFSRNAAALRAQYFGGSPSEYESGVDSAVSEAGGTMIVVYARVRAPDGGPDTSSRKVMATAIRLPAKGARPPVHWHPTFR